MDGRATAGHRRCLSGTVEKLDFARREISLRTAHETRILRSRKPLNLPGVRVGDTINLALGEDGVVLVWKTVAQGTPRL